MVLKQEGKILNNNNFNPTTTSPLFFIGFERFIQVRNGHD